MSSASAGSAANLTPSQGQNWNWNTTKHTSLPVPPPTHVGYPTAKPLPLHRLQFSPLGLFDLRRRIGIFANDHKMWNMYAQNWRASDIAWFAAGASDDGMHYPGHGQGFFSELVKFRESLPLNEAGYEARKAFGQEIQKLVHDLATMWDRTFGSTTMILHVEGTTVPGTPVRPEYLRCSTYIPPYFVRTNPDAHQPIAQLVQTFIEVVGVPTVNQWAINARLQGWKLNQRGGKITPNHPSPLQIPVSTSAHYIFRGQPARTSSIATPPPATRVPSPPASPVSIDSDDESSDLSQDAALLAAIQRIASLEAELAAREEAYIEQHNESRAYIADLQAQLSIAQNALTSSPPVSRFPFRPPTYSVSQPATPTRPRLPASRGTSPSKTQAALPTTVAFLEEHQLGKFIIAVQATVRHVSPAKWYEELRILGIEEEILSGLLDCMTIDLQ
ncbi:hypothetical protein B0H15DRAFT_958755 [Mycena belliarum]|uniref:Uncharacterized protein n=1 Tax=Mycena belliarum TaxID=1033014 RepID=A0AAD6XHA8_9AGAR|nr:hypothetical protein B0H15DRAFT_958755 [Mycena belliae]